MKIQTGNPIMKKLILITLLIAVFSGVPASGQSRGPSHTAEEVIKLIQNVKVERSYLVGTQEELVLTPGQAIRLNFKDNPAGVKDFIFFYNNRYKTVYIYNRYTNDTEKEYRGTRLYLKKKKAYTSARLYFFYEYEPKDNKAFVKFRATMSLSEKDRQQIKEIDEAYRRSEAEELQAVSELKWDLEEKVLPLKIIMDDPNGPNMVKLRKKYGLEGLVSNAKDDYGKLKLITGWVHKQWKHTSNNKPSKSDPLTILKEASEGKRFRCVEYAIVVTGCTRSLGMPSRRLGLKRSDVETTKRGGGHVVAEVWLKQFNKWVFVDGQWGAIPQVNGVPLNAVEFQHAIACESPGLKIHFATKKDEKEYLAWISPYLYYFDFNLDQRFFAKDYEKRRYSPLRGKIMLVPKGAKNPKVFQRNKPIKNCRYISNPKAFYPQISGKKSGFIQTVIMKGN